MADFSSNDESFFTQGNPDLFPSGAKNIRYNIK